MDNKYTYNVDKNGCVEVAAMIGLKNDQTYKLLSAQDIDWKVVLKDEDNTYIDDTDDLLNYISKLASKKQPEVEQKTSATFYLKCPIILAEEGQVFVDEDYPNGDNYIYVCKKDDEGVESIISTNEFELYNLRITIQLPFSGANPAVDRRNNTYRLHTGEEGVSAGIYKVILERLVRGEYVAVSTYSLFVKKKIDTSLYRFYCPISVAKAGESIDANLYLYKNDEVLDWDQINKEGLEFELSDQENNPIRWSEVYKGVYSESLEPGTYTILAKKSKNGIYTTVAEYSLIVMDKVDSIYSKGYAIYKATVDTFVEIPTSSVSDYDYDNNRFVNLPEGWWETPHRAIEQFSDETSTPKVYVSFANILSDRSNITWTSPALYEDILKNFNLAAKNLNIDNYTYLFGKDVAEESEGHEMVVFGGGTNGTSVFKLDGSGYLAGGLLQWGRKRDENGDYIYDNGNSDDPFGLKVKGEIEALGGNIAGWNIGTVNGESVLQSNTEDNEHFIVLSPSTLYSSESGNTGWRLNSDGTGSLAGGNITWDEHGELTINSTINAVEGNIAGWLIGSDGDESFLYSGNGTTLLILSPSQLCATNNGITAWNLKQDGSGLIANGAISWDANGKLTIAGDTTIKNMSSEYGNSVICRDFEGFTKWVPGETVGAYLLREYSGTNIPFDGYFSGQHSEITTGGLLSKYVLNVYTNNQGNSSVAALENAAGIGAYDEYDKYNLWEFYIPEALPASYISQPIFPFELPNPKEFLGREIQLEISINSNLGSMMYYTSNVEPYNIPDYLDEGLQREVLENIFKERWLYIPFKQPQEGEVDYAWKYVKANVSDSTNSKLYDTLYDRNSYNNKYVKLDENNGLLLSFTAASRLLYGGIAKAKFVAKREFVKYVEIYGGEGQRIPIYFYDEESNRRGTLSCSVYYWEMISTDFEVRPFGSIQEGSGIQISNPSAVGRNDSSVEECIQFNKSTSTLGANDIISNIIKNNRDIIQLEDPDRTPSSSNAYVLTREAKLLLGID